MYRNRIFENINLRGETYCFMLMEFTNCFINHLLRYFVNQLMPIALLVTLHFE